MNFLRKIQQLPEQKRKIILRSVSLVFAIFLFILYILNVKKIIKSVNVREIKEKFQTEKLEENLKKIEWPKIQFPELNNLPQNNENQ